MIESTSSSDRASRANALAADAQRPAAPRMQSGSDSLSTDKAANAQLHPSRHAAALGA
jgi:hypothetical protein